MAAPSFPSSPMGFTLIFGGRRGGISPPMRSEVPVTRVVRLRWVQGTLIQNQFGSSGISHISALGAEHLQTAPMLLGVSVEWSYFLLGLGLG
ncbi:hypothetical protein RHMOL_Rhmol02G0123000 [Rhododendron molle]|uniref:Uncharacterized protein n=1 Tax=Rhododendron molle TaxID=49168 RepID=A0ACC0PRL3_RHOML|nr:hypothetical protein RHMOL_Rhmol02G0123000 [Rhododendron molle]